MPAITEPRIEPGYYSTGIMVASNDREF